jgi:hypothetical protein
LMQAQCFTTPPLTIFCKHANASNTIVWSSN